MFISNDDDSSRAALRYPIITQILNNKSSFVLLIKMDGLLIKMEGKSKILENCHWILIQLILTSLIHLIIAMFMEANCINWN